MDYDIRPATQQDVADVAVRLRSGDRAELAALGLTPLQGVQMSFDNSLWARVGIWQGQVACIWGLGSISLLSGLGGAWMLSTPVVNGSRKQFLRASRQQVGQMRQIFPRLCCQVDQRYGQAVRWLGWLGFVPRQVGQINGISFLTCEV
jgi:hypothetical protein